MSADVELMFCDETNVKRPSGAEFFLYGGLVIPGAKFAAVCDVVAGARASIGLEPNEPLKFSVRERPKRVEPAAWTEAKGALMVGLAPLDLHVFANYVTSRSRTKLRRPTGHSTPSASPSTSISPVRRRRASLSSTTRRISAVATSRMLRPERSAFRSSRAS